jgi:thioredoxin reductase (NADPH)
MYDVIVLGAGPAGLAAAMYAGRYLLKTLVLSEDVGGQMMLAHKVENYPGFLSIPGPELMTKFKEHAEKFDAKIVLGRCDKIEKNSSGFVVTSGDKRFEGKTIIYTLGSRHRFLGVPGEKELAGHGVSYCATCDGAFFRGKTVAIIGGGNSAFLGATVVSQYASKMYMIHRRDTFRADPILIEQVKKYPVTEFVLNNSVQEIQGDKVVQRVLLEHEHQGSKELALDGVFIEIGSDPAIVLATDLGVDVTEDNLIKVRADQRTNIEGFYAAGDVTNGSNNFRQAITSAAEGTIAADAVFNALKE